jgi:hypothetical protein
MAAAVLMDANTWNERYPVGTEVVVTKVNGDAMYARTAAPAQRVGVFEMVELEGYQGLWLLSWLRVRRKAPPGASGE